MKKELYIVEEMVMNRKLNSLKNIISGVGAQCLLLIMQFVTRTVFVYTLSADYLGVNGLFSNILGVLSLAELGFGTAIIYSMYKPVATNDERQIAGLVNFYKRIYRVVGSIVAIAGLALVPFLDYLIKDKPNISHLTFIYLLYLAGTVSSYFLIYKSIIIEAHQKRYVITIYQKCIVIIQNIIQIIVLLCFHNFILYLIIQIVMGILSNFVVSMKADKMYPYLKKYKEVYPCKEVKQEIVKNTVAMSCHKIGTVVVYNTDNIIMSAFVSLTSVGLYSNYMMIVTNIKILINLIFSAFSASIGNLAISEEEEKLYSVYKTLNFLGFWIFSYCTVAFYILLSPFISIWIGNEYVFSNSVLFVILLIFYLTGMRQVTLNYRDALGLFWYDRYKPLFESLINLVVSIVLVKRFGIIGVLVGTVVGTLCTSFWVEPYILFKYKFKRSVANFFIKYFIYTIVFVVCGGVTYYIVDSVNGGLGMLLIKGIILTLLYNIMIALIFFRSEEFKNLLGALKEMCSHVKKKENVIRNEVVQ